MFLQILGIMYLMPIIGIPAENAIRKIFGIFKHTEEKKYPRRTFKPGVLGKYEPE